MSCLACFLLPSPPPPLLPPTHWLRVSVSVSAGPIGLALGPQRAALLTCPTGEKGEKRGQERETFLYPLFVGGGGRRRHRPRRRMLCERGQPQRGGCVSARLSVPLCMNGLSHLLVPRLCFRYIIGHTRTHEPIYWGYLRLSRPTSLCVSTHAFGDWEAAWVRNGCVEAREEKKKARKGEGGKGGTRLERLSTVATLWLVSSPILAPSRSSAFRTP